MNITTSATAATRKSFKTDSPNEDLIVKTDVGSAAAIRILSNRPITVDGVPTADTTGMTVIAGASFVLPGCQQIWMIGTATDATAASFEIMAFKSNRR